MYRINERKNHVHVTDAKYGLISDKVRPNFMLALNCALHLHDQNISVDRFYEPLELLALFQLNRLLNGCLKLKSSDHYTVWDAFGKPDLDMLRQMRDITLELRRYLRKGELNIAQDFRRSFITLLDEKVFEKAITHIKNKLPALIKLKKDIFLVNDGRKDSQDVCEEEVEILKLPMLTKVKLERANAEHKLTLEFLTRYLEERGYIVSCSHLIDLYTNLKSGPAIFEIKSTNEKNERAQCRHALSQLYEYQYLYSLNTATLWLITSCELSQLWLREYLITGRNINLLWVVDNELTGPSIAFLK